MGLYLFFPILENISVDRSAVNVKSLNYDLLWECSIQ